MGDDPKNFNEGFSGPADIVDGISAMLVVEREKESNTKKIKCKKEISWLSDPTAAADSPTPGVVPRGFFYPPTPSSC